MPGLAHDREADLLEQPHDPLAEEHRVVGDHDPSARRRAATRCCAAAGSRAAGRRPAAGGCAPASDKPCKLVDARDRGSRSPRRTRRCSTRAGSARRAPRQAIRDGADEVDPDVPFLGELRRPCVEPDPHADLQPVRPRRGRVAGAAPRAPTRRLRRRRRRRRRSRRRWSRPPTLAERRQRCARCVARRRGRRRRPAPPPGPAVSSPRCRRGGR